MERPFYLYQNFVFFFLAAFLASPVSAAGGGLQTCSSSSLWKARGVLARLISQEALRVAKENFQRDASPQLQSQCQIVVDRLEESGEGSVLFTDLNSELYQKIASYSGSWVSHTGVAFFEDSQWVVYESRAPSGLSRPTPLCDFIARSANYKIAVAKPQVPLSSWQVEKIRLVLGEKMQQDYDFTFNLENPKKQFCSKLVYESFKKIGLSLGTPETLSEFFNHSMKSNSEKEEMTCFFKAWFQGNIFLEKGEWKSQKVIPWEQVTLTPASQYESALRGQSDSRAPFVLIYESK